MAYEVQSIQDIINQLNPTVAGRKDFISQQINAVPQSLQSSEAALQNQLNGAFGQIQQGASNRGIFFSGIPLAEQAQYTGTQYAPALAKLRQSAMDQQGALRQTLSDIDSDVYKQAFGINQQQQKDANDYQERLRQEQQAREKEERDWQRQQQLQQQKMSHDEKMARMSGGGGAAAPTATYTRKSDGGFNFKDNSGRTISAAQYAQMMGVPVQNVLADMASQGDQYARQVLNAMANDPGYQKNPTGFKNYYRPIFWGTYET